MDPRAIRTDIDGYLRGTRLQDCACDAWHQAATVTTLPLRSHFH